MTRSQCLSLAFVLAFAFLVVIPEGNLRLYRPRTGWPNMHKLCTHAAAAALLLLPAFLCKSVHAQLATVTFYTHGSNLATGMPGSRHGIFVGGIFDGKQRLFVVRGGHFPKNNRYITVALPAGDHDFAANQSPNPPKKGYVHAHLEAGKQYFFRAQSESDGILMVEWFRGRLDEVNCATAAQDLRSGKALDPSNILLAPGVSTVPAQSPSTCF